MNLFVYVILLTSVILFWMFIKVARLKNLTLVILAFGILIGFCSYFVLLRMGLVPTSHMDLQWPTENYLENAIPIDAYQDGSNVRESPQIDVVARKLQRQIRILCWIPTKPSSYEQVKLVKATWGQRCNVLLFTSPEKSISIPTVVLSGQKENDSPWKNTKEALKYMYQNHLKDMDWFFKADQYMYTVTQNLRHMLSSFRASDPLYFDLHYKMFADTIDSTNGIAGYVLSREALRRFVEEALPHKHKCEQEDDHSEAVAIGACLKNVGVISMETRDSNGRERFFHFMSEKLHIRKSTTKSYWYWPEAEWCSTSAISFHSVPWHQMYVMEFFTNHAWAYGITYNYTSLPDFFSTTAMT